MAAVVGVADLRELVDEGKVQRGVTAGFCVPDALSVLLPSGLSRQTPTVIVPGVGALSLLLALLAAPSRAGAWCAVVGIPEMGPVPAAEHGVDLGRLALVRDPGPDWPAVLAALIDGFPVVVVRPATALSATLTRRLHARARQRRTALIVYGGRWPGAGAVLSTHRPGWEGLGQGCGRLRRRMLTVEVSGRAAPRPRVSRVWLPDAAGGIAVVESATLRLVGRWWNRQWGSWGRILLRLEHGEREWVVRQEGPDGAERVTRYEAERAARADVAAVLGPDRDGWQEITAAELSPLQAHDRSSGVPARTSGGGGSRCSGLSGD